MAQLLPIVRKFFPCGMVDGLLTVCVLLNLAQIMAMSSGTANLLPRRALKFKTNFQRQPPSRSAGGPARSVRKSFAEYPN
jgi:hypothetical protein